MMNMAVAFLAQLIFVIPFSLFVLVVHNWLLGYFMCYALPMAQVKIEIQNLIKDVAWWRPSIN